MKVEITQTVDYQYLPRDLAEWMMEYLEVGNDTIHEWLWTTAADMDCSTTQEIENMTRMNAALVALGADLSKPILIKFSW